MTRTKPITAAAPKHVIALRGGAITIHVPIEKLVADANAKAVLAATMPGMTSHPHYEMFKAMSLKQLQPYSDGKITPELLAKAEVALAQVQ